MDVNPADFERDANRLDARASALEDDAIELRRRARNLRMGAEYIRATRAAKVDNQPAPVDHQ